MKTYHTKWLNIRENSPNLPASVVADMTEKTNKIEQDYLLKILDKSSGNSQNQQVVTVNIEDDESKNDINV